jgi:hypothetical protein
MNFNLLYSALRKIQIRQNIRILEIFADLKEENLFQI